ncbi:hypothetical protein DFH27DRAFT_637557 [Peziza echinospora]|nr:hypothetical protein DFH27DRAFT_637557 [Peziza echinospora]
MPEPLSPPPPPPIPSPYTLLGAKTFVATQPIPTIALQLQSDHALVTQHTSPSNIDYTHIDTVIPAPLPSLLVYFLPRADTSLATELAILLSKGIPASQYHDFPPTTTTTPLPLPLAQLRYTSLTDTIREYLALHIESPPHQEKYPQHIVPTLEEYEAALKVLNYLRLAVPLETPLAALPGIVKEHIHAIASSSAPTPVPVVPDHDPSIASQPTPNVPPPPPPPPKEKPQKPKGGKKGTNPTHAQRSPAKCYICNFLLPPASPVAIRRGFTGTTTASSTPTPTHPSLCTPCASFNLSNLHLSSPAALDLRGKTAFVTGGRTNLGFATAKRLVECGAHVLVSSRYPWDAVGRYRELFKGGGREGSEGRRREGGSISVLGADFRCMDDLKGVVGGVGRWLGRLSEKDENEAGSGEGEGGRRRLDILINNAAQTWTDDVSWEEGMVEREQVLEVEVGGLGGLLPDCDREAEGGEQTQPRTQMRVEMLHTNYTPRVRGGNRAIGNYSEAGQAQVQSPLMKLLGDGETNLQDQKVQVEGILGSGGGGGGAALTTTSKDHKTTWVQRLHDIPYQDIWTTYTVNAFTPLVLIRELLPYMYPSPTESTSPPSPTPTATPQTPHPPKKPSAYIINVSAREGQPEPKPSHKRSGYHVHTNMAKAALNMLTETEAAVLWKEHRIAMNSVDPGFLSVDKNWAEMWGWDGRECPLTWEDGAGRVLCIFAVKEERLKSGYENKERLTYSTKDFHILSHLF